jgi:hypothetical protein
MADGAFESSLLLLSDCVCGFINIAVTCNRAFLLTPLHSYVCSRSPFPAFRQAVNPAAFTFTKVATAPIAGQKPGTSGLRKQVPLCFHPLFLLLSCRGC